MTESERIRHEDAKKVNLRLTNPDMYKSVMLFVIFCISMTLNYWFSKPTFNPYGIQRPWIGLTFLIIGMALILLLNVFRNLKLVRITLAVAGGLLIFWGISNTQQSFAGKASFAFPILLFYVASIILKDLLQSPVNPMTRKDNNGD